MENKPLRWFYFRQNNVRGRFVENSALSKHVLVEATGDDAACEILERLGANRSDWCDCCGWRWSRPTASYSEPLVYGQDWHLAEGSVRVHHADKKMESKPGND